MLPKSALCYLLTCLLLAPSLHAQNAGNRIIRNIPALYNADLLQLESDGVQAFLAAHNLPSTDAALLYQYGRTDLRDELRSWIFTILENIIATSAASRTTHQQNVYNWFESLVYQNEVAEYQAAVAEHQRFEGNQCEFTLDPGVAKAYSLSYNGIPFCDTLNIQNTFSSQPTPAPDYYLAVGIEKSYSAPIAADPQGAPILAETESLNEIDLEYAIIPAVAAGVATTALYATSVIAPFAFRAYIAGAETIEAVTDSLDQLVAGGLEAGPVVATIGITAAIGIQAGLQNQLLDDDNDALQAQKDYLASLLASCNANYNGVDLNAFLTDATGNGHYKLISTFIGTTLPDVPSSTPLPTRTEGADPIWGSYLGGPYNSVQYTDWAGVQWTASLWGNYILQYQTNNPSVTSFATTIKVTEDYTVCQTEGICPSKQYTASRIGANWLITPQTPPTNGIACPPDPTTGLSPPNGNGYASCNWLVGNSIGFQSSTLTSFSSDVASWFVIPPPVFDTNGVVNFIDGNAQSIVLSAQVPNAIYAQANYGKATTGIYSITGNVPPGFAVLPSSSNVTLSYNGQPNSNLPGTYNLTATAQFGSSSAYVIGTSPLAVTVRAGDAIQVRSNTITGYVGTPISYQISTAGHPNPMISLSGIHLQPGLSFTQNSANGAIIQGTPTAPGSTSGEIVTNYGATAPLSISVTYLQAPAFTSTNYWQFKDNVLNRFEVNTARPATPNQVPSLFASLLPFPTGFVTSPATFDAGQPGIENVPWLQFQDYHNGTAILSGTPPSGAGTQVIYLASVLPNSLPSFQTLTLSSNPAPTVTGSNILTTTTSPSGVVTVTIPVVNISVSSLVFQSSLDLTTQGNSVTLAPAGDYGLFAVNSYLVGAPGGSCSASADISPRLAGLLPKAASIQASDTSTGSNLVPFETFYIEIDKAPSIVSSASTSFSEGIANTFYIRTTGFPEGTTVPNSTSSATPMRVTLTGILPQGVTYTDLSPLGLPTGTGILSGTPTQTGIFPLTFTANNSVGTPAVQDFTLTVTAPGDVNNDGVVNCADTAIVKAAFGTYYGEAAYDPRADVNHDYVVNILDLTFVTSYLPKGLSCR